MKNLTKIICPLLLSIFLVISCQSEKELYTYKAQGKKNGKIWTSEINPFFLRGADGDSLHIRFYSELGNLRAEQIDISTIPFEIGDYFLTNEPGEPNAFLSYISYDIISSEYFLDTERQDLFLTIDEISEDRKSIRGSFNATFILNEAYEPFALPKKIEFIGVSYSAKEGW